MTATLKCLGLEVFKQQFLIVLFSSMNAEPGFERQLEAADFAGSTMLEPGCYGFETAPE